MVVSSFMVLPWIDSTTALTPPPEDPVLSNEATSPTLYPSPDSLTMRDSTEPLLTDLIVESDSLISLGSVMKSLSIPRSPTPYGNVFLMS